jgi:uracil-DNA glycosylase family 4
MTYVPPEINAPAPGGVLLVGRDPGEQEVEEGRPFVGLAGELLDKVLSETGLRRQDVNIANVVGYRPPNNEFHAHDEAVVRAGLEELGQLRDRLQPRLTITLGNEAAYSCVPDWPTRGRGVFGAKGIEDRRGYFWDTPHGGVLTTLHPAGVLRKLVPGRYLLGMDFRRGRQWLNGRLPRDAFPREIIRLTSPLQVEKLRRQTLLAWDIENKWDSTALVCSGYCGDDLQPYVAAWGYEFDHFGLPLLQSGVPLVGHNGAAHDCPAILKFYGKAVKNYRHDTQQMWWALEPDLAGTGDTDEEDKELRPGRMTRKGLAFLASIYFNLEWWKNYPDEDDQDFLPKMIVLNGRDAFVTRWAAACLLPEMVAVGVMPQYEAAVALYPALLEMQLKGIRINEALRQERIEALVARSEAAREESRMAGVDYLAAHAIESFVVRRRCDCCGGGSVSRGACWRCAGFEKKPGKKASVSLSACQKCGGTGKLQRYVFNPFSPDQMKRFLYEAVGAPQNVWKGKVTTDATALKKVLRWARGQ